jgi:cephalosporin hydroxylase
MASRSYSGFAMSALVAALAFGAGYVVRGARAPEVKDTLPDAASSKKIVDDFHELYHESQGSTWNNTFWRGVRTQKLPLDAWIFQEIIHETQPDVIVEAGTFMGGSAYFMASLMDLIGKGRVITIDIEDHPGKPRHHRITYLIGSSTSEEMVARVRSLIGKDETVMVVLDSDHRAEHVLNELRIYGPMVTVGNYLIAEDTNVNGHPVKPDFGPGPWEAVQTFLKENQAFTVDSRREKLLLTFNPGGYLIRVR